MCVCVCVRVLQRWVAVVKLCKEVSLHFVLSAATILESMKHWPEPCVTDKGKRMMERDQ